MQFLIRRDGQARLHFASLQGPTAAAILGRHGRSPSDLDTVYLVQHPGTPDERLRHRADAVLTTLVLVGGPWRLAGALRVLPTGLLDGAYRLVARRRYRLFGKYAACQVPTPAQRARFLD